MNTAFLRPAALSLVLALTLSACNKQEEPAPITDPAAEGVPAETVAAPEEAAPVAEPEPIPEPAPAPKPRPKPAPVASAPAPAPQPAPPPVCYDCGTITAITEVKQAGSGSGAGAVAGGVAGGVIGHQFGGGSGKDVATALGALAGAAAGHMAEKKIRSTVTYDVTVTMESGGTRVINVPATNGLAVGTPVRVDGSTILPR